MKRITNPKKVYFSKDMKMLQEKENMYEIMSKIADKKKTYFIEATFRAEKKLWKIVNSCMKASPTDGFYLEGTIDASYSEAFNIATYKITWDLVEKK